MSKRYTDEYKNTICAAELIKLCEMVSDFSLSNQLFKEFATSITGDDHFTNSVAYLQQ